EQVHLLLGDLDPVAVAEVRTDRGPHLVDTIENRCCCHISPHRFRPDGTEPWVSSSPARTGESHAGTNRRWRTGSSQMGRTHGAGFSNLPDRDSKQVPIREGPRLILKPVAS